MIELLEAAASWWSLIVVVVVFGFAPGLCLRLIVLTYPRSTPRRAELIAELYAVPRIQRPLWVAEQLEVALFEGLGHRISAAIRRRREVSSDHGDLRPAANVSFRPLPEPSQWWGDMLVFSSPADLYPVQQFVEKLALRAGLDAQRVSDLCLAVNEVATNTLVHTKAAGVLSVWQDLDTDCLICEITDSGQLVDWLVGRIPSARSEPHGRGLILVNMLCDLVEMPTDQICTTIRLHMRLR